MTNFNDVRVILSIAGTVEACPDDDNYFFFHMDLSNGDYFLVRFDELEPIQADQIRAILKAQEQQ